MGWFLRFKLRMIINDVAQIMAIKITQGNINDRTPTAELSKKQEVLYMLIFSKLYTKKAESL